MLKVLAAAAVVASALGVESSTSKTAVALEASANATTKTTKTMKMSYTFYGWLDNCPPGAYMLYPRPGSKTMQAQGDGTYGHPISFAGADKKSVAWYMEPGTVIYIPKLKKYFIMEDDCTDCNHKKDTIDLWMGPDSFLPGIIDCENQITPGSNHKVDVIVHPSSDESVDTTPFFNGTCIEKVDPSNKCTPNKPVTDGCNICQLNWDPKPADGSGQKAYPRAGLTCAELAKVFESNVTRLEHLNPSWDCSDGKKIPYSNKDMCQGDSCGNP